MAGKGWIWEKIARGETASTRDHRLWERFGPIAEERKLKILAPANNLLQWEALFRLDPIKADAILTDVLIGKRSLGDLQDLVAKTRLKRDATSVAERPMDVIMAEVIALDPGAAMPNADIAEGAVWGDRHVGLAADSIYHRDREIDADPDDPSTWGAALNSVELGYDWSLLVSPTFKSSRLHGCSHREFLLRIGYVLSIYDYVWVYCSSIYEYESIEQHAIKYGWINKNKPKNKKSKQQKLKLILPR